MHEHETTGPVGIFHHSRARADLAEKSRLLIARYAGNGDSAAEEIRLAIDFARGTNLRQDTAGHAEQTEQFVVPFASLNIEEHGARSVARVGHMRATAGQIPNQPGINSAKRELPGFGHLFCAGNIVEYPLKLCA